MVFIALHKSWIKIIYYKYYINQYNHVRLINFFEILNKLKYLNVKFD